MCYFQRVFVYVRSEMLWHTLVNVIVNMVNEVGIVLRVHIHVLYYILSFKGLLMDESNINIE